MSILGTTAQRITVYNVDTVPIPAYRIAVLGTDNTAKTFRHNVACTPVKACVTTTGGTPIGVTEDSIGPGKYGTVIVLGTAIIETTDTSAAAGDEIKMLATSGNEGKVDCVTAEESNVTLGICVSADYSLNIMGVAGGIKGWVADDASTATTITVVTCQINLVVGQGVAIGNDGDA